MIDIENTRKIVAKGLKQYLGCTIIRTNQTAEMPKYPFIGYNITVLSNENKGTYGEYEDGTKRKPHTMTMSVTAFSDDYTEAVELANKAHEWLDCIGTQYLNDNDVILQSVGSVNDRSNILTAEYQYSFGFDCFFYIFDEIQNKIQGQEQDFIETATINKYYEKI